MLMELGALLLLFLTRLVVTVLWLQLPGAFVCSLSIACADFPHDFFKIGLRHTGENA